MGHRFFIAAAAVGGALALAGCGGSPAAAPEPNGLGFVVGPRSDGPAAVERTDGRLGAATAIRAGEPLRALSRGGRPDLHPRRNAPRRDGIGAGAACANPGLVPAADTLGAVTAATLCLLNGERADRGLAPLAANGKLASAATLYAQDLVAGSYFSHTGRDGSGVADRIKRSGYLPPNAGWALGENLAWGTGALGLPSSIMQAWMNSPGHRDNILNPDFREVGVGIVVGNPARPDGLGATYATEFGVIEGIDRRDRVTTTRKSTDRAKQRARKRARRRARARHAHHARQARIARQARHRGKGRGKAHTRRGKLRGPKARIAM